MIHHAILLTMATLGLASCVLSLILLRRRPHPRWLALSLSIVGGSQFVLAIHWAISLARDG